jgi:hypothetical protein
MTRERPLGGVRDSLVGAERERNADGSDASA